MALVLSVISILVMPTLAYLKGRTDPVGALAMLPVILWQGWETLEEAREEGVAE